MAPTLRTGRVASLSTSIQRLSSALLLQAAVDAGAAAAMQETSRRAGIAVGDAAERASTGTEPRRFADGLTHRQRKRARMARLRANLQDPKP